LQHQDGAKVQQTTTDANGKFRLTALEAGAYSLQVQAANYYPLHYEFVLRPRQPLSLNLDLQKKRDAARKCRIRAGYLTIDPEKTGSSYTFTHQDLEKLPDSNRGKTPATSSTNLMPGASDSHDNFLAVRGTEFSLHEFINGGIFPGQYPAAIFSRSQPPNFRSRRFL